MFAARFAARQPDRHRWLAGRPGADRGCRDRGRDQPPGRGAALAPGAFAEAREEFSATLEGRCDWYEGLGAAIATKAPVSPPEELAGRAREPTPIVLERPGGGDGVPPGLGIAWTTLHLETLLAFEPALAEAAARLSDDVFS